MLKRRSRYSYAECENNDTYPNFDEAYHGVTGPETYLDKSLKKRQEEFDKFQERQTEKDRQKMYRNMGRYLLMFILFISTSLGWILPLLEMRTTSDIYCYDNYPELFLADIPTYFALCIASVFIPLYQYIMLRFRHTPTNMKLLGSCAKISALTSSTSLLELSLLNTVKNEGMWFVVFMSVKTTVVFMYILSQLVAGKSAHNKTPKILRTIIPPTDP